MNFRGERERLAIRSIGVGITVLALKALAWRLTGSAALYGDALESFVNVATALATLIALAYAARPADSNHPFGHDKAELFSAALEAALIIVAAISIFEAAWHHWRLEQPILSPLRGIALNAAAAALNGGWALVLLRAARRLQSPALAADGRHLAADLVTSAGVILGVGLAALTGRVWFDPLAAALTGAYVLWSGTHLLRESASGLLDEAAPEELDRRIRALVAAHAAGAIEAHDLRTRRAGRTLFLEFHLVVPGAMQVADAHDICDRVEGALKAEIANLRVQIHVEPEGKAKHQGVLVL